MMIMKGRKWIDYLGFFFPPEGSGERRGKTGGHGLAMWVWEERRKD